MAQEQNKYMNLAELLKTLIPILESKWGYVRASIPRAINAKKPEEIKEEIQNMQETLGHEQVAPDNKKGHAEAIQILDQIGHARFSNAKFDGASDFLYMLSALSKTFVNEEKITDLEVKNIINAIQKVPDTKLQYDFLKKLRLSGFANKIVQMAIAQNEHADARDLDVVLSNYNDIDKETYGKMFNDLVQMIKQEIDVEKNKELPNVDTIKYKADTASYNIRRAREKGIIDDNIANEMQNPFIVDNILASDAPDYMQKFDADRNAQLKAEMQAEIDKLKQELRTSQENEERLKNSLDYAHQTIEKQDKQLKEKDKEIEAKDRIIALKDAALTQLKNAVEKFTKALKTTKIITNAKIDEIRKQLELDK